MDPYAQYDETCDVCGVDAYDCDCPECPECGVTGDPRCYSRHGLKPAADSVQAFCDHIGIEPVADALRAIDKHNVEHVWLVLPDGRRLYHHDQPALKQLPPYLRIRAVGVGGIAWDGSDWEYGEEVSPSTPLGWSALDRARECFHEALEQHTRETST